jgi:hypothetical protein
MLRFTLLFLPASLLIGCPTAEVNEEPTPTPDYGYEEEDDDGNDSPFEPEEVDTDWNAEANRFFTITGTMSSCDYDASENWPWTGDEDNIALTLPGTGVLAMETNWTSDGNESDLDWLWWSEVPESGPMGGNATPDHQISGDGSEMHYEFGDDTFEEGQTMVFTFLCASGGGGEYSMRLELELD